MERLLIKLCDSSPDKPFPFWESGTVGHCFTQLVLNSLAHVLLALISACYISTPRYPDSVPPCSPGWRLRLVVSFLLSVLPLLDLLPAAIPSEAVPGPLALEVLAGGVATIAWITHSLALRALARSQGRLSRGPLILALTALLPAPAMVLTLLWHCQQGTVLTPLQLAPFFRLCFVILQLTMLLAYLLGWAVPGDQRQRRAWASDSLFLEPQRPEMAEDGESWLSRFFYLWLAPLLARGARGQIQQPQDTCLLPYRLQTAYLARLFRAQWREQARLWLVLYGALGQRYLTLGLLKLAGTLLGFSGPLLLSLLVGFLENEREPLSQGVLYAMGLAGGAVLGALLQNQYGYELRKVALQARGAVLGAVYHKTLHLGPNRPSAGEALNLLGTDSERLLNFANSFHEAWGLPLQLSITLYLLYQQVGLAFLGGLGLALLLVPLNKVIATRILAKNESMLQHKDARVKLMTELLCGIRVIKFCGWEQTLGSRVQKHRAQELQQLRVIKYLDAACVYLWAALPVVISIVIFITYVLMGHQLTAAKVFTALALIRMLILPLNNFPWVINGLLEAKVSLGRLQRFLDLPDHDPQAYYSPDPPTEPLTVLELHEAMFSWDPIGTGLKTFITHLEVKKGSLVGIVGKVGCGKSSLLAAISGELHRLSGQISVAGRCEGFGLATQEPWIQFATIRDNILFGKAFDAHLYWKVLEACALHDDLAILPDGDQTEVGEKGVTLSGGQKARVALARAVYQENKLYLLDDPLAAVDADVASHLLQKCILGILGHTTRLLCTHRTEYLEQADIVLLLEGGRIIQAGPPSEILPLVQAAPDAQSEDVQKTEPAAALEAWKPEKESEESKEVGPTSSRLLQEERKKEGAVAFQVYQAYWKAVGGCLSLAILFFLLLMQGTRNAADWWLSHWISQLKIAENGSQELGRLTSQAPSLLSPQLLLFSPGGLFAPVSAWPKATPNSSLDLQFYLTVYGSIASANSICTLLRAILFATGILQAAATLHQRLLHRVLRAPVTFFDCTPTGRILNRFSSDVACADDSLPFVLNILLANAVGLLGLLAVLGLGLPWLLLLLPPLGSLYYSVQRHYRASSRELRRLSSLTLSPLYTHLSESLAGLSIIRAARATCRFEEENEKLLELNQRCQFAASACLQWLDIRLQLMGAAVVSAIAIIALIQHHQHLANPGLVGLSLSYALSLTGLLSGLVSSFTQTEAMMVSVERLEEYSCDLPSEPQGQQIQVEVGWLSQGHVEFQDVVLAYRPGLPNALDGVTFNVLPGEKIGIVGRTGSGKSSLLLVLFRLVEPSSGHILLDGMDTSLLGLSDLRSELAIIPQEPFLFSGTVRENLDPLGRHEDEALWQALEECHLSEVITPLGGLDGELGEGGRRLSLGQRQLLCLARALLTDAKILCIDEATASVDQKTDQLLQQTICNRFADKTVLTIAHRLNTILNSDRVLVLQAGRVAELDTPAALRSRPYSLFQQLLQNSQQ
ncbi:ATP-binding cassette sub-family C member 10 isoform X1 [Phascolarctos cinereus]|uniref:ATP-binding cassette sub-family C member 10 n=1 Tax=Phascolarctos cinereus TaxID=38626 RepID=A0A6P5JE92_PHACI|nr:multidrug resistance-associated protein 7 isoform X1 [Phascolarctos cinereus]XP_020832520.1 multidrug resistance-associated protein 7 isoform X1 [Phascolarctos cinereus]XP_020832521.1 multidrug resistance-associated protein 7 isoform X1 [Phascolarctos cinereus]